MRVPSSAPRAAAFLAAAAVLTAHADELFPAAGWKDGPNPLASPDAVRGGQISLYAGQYPKSFNYYLENSGLSYGIMSSLFETLLSSDPLTADYAPRIAERWSISDDKRSFTFWIDPRARWSDGAPVTAEDVKWTFETVMDPKNLTGSHKVSLETFSAPEILSNGVIRLTSREVHWRNLGAAGGFFILPRHAFDGQDFNKINFEFPVVSGPYRLGEVREHVAVQLVRREGWWAGDLPVHRHVVNFDRIVYRFYDEPENAFDAFKQGLIDYYGVSMARMWVKETQGERFEKNWIIKQKVQNYTPIGFQGFAMNMRRPPFDDVRVRMAMAYLLDRERMNRTLMYSQYFLHRSFYEDLYSPESPCTNRFFEYNPDQARRLLAEAGWSVNPRTGWLEKDGRRLTFRFLSREQSNERFTSIYGESLKDAGIEMVLDRKDWAAWVRDMDEYNFDMTWAAWSSGIFKDPESMWASKEADRRQGDNYAGFKDPEVDALIEKQRAIFDLAQRNEICRQIDARVTRQAPYVLLWNLNYARILYWNRFGTPPTVFGKYDEGSMDWYWWYDEDSAADLRDAMKTGAALPARAPVVVFDEAFRGPQAPLQ